LVKKKEDKKIVEETDRYVIRLVDHKREDEYGRESWHFQKRWKKYKDG